MRIIPPTGVDRMRSFVRQPVVSEPTPGRTVDQVFPLDDQPQPLPFTEERARGENLDLDGNDLAGTQSLLALVLQDGLPRRGFLFVELSLRYPQPSPRH